MAILNGKDKISPRDLILWLECQRIRVCGCLLCGGGQYASHVCMNIVEVKCALQERWVIAYIISALNLFCATQSPIWCKPQEPLKFYISQPSLQIEIALTQFYKWHMSRSHWVELLWKDPKIGETSASLGPVFVLLPFLFVLASNPSVRIGAVASFFTIFTLWR